MQAPETMGRVRALSITSRVKVGERIRHLITSCVIACVRPEAHVRAVRNTISQRRLSMRDSNRLAEDYIALWNETDQKRRLALLAEGWTADASYVDPLMQGVGHRELDGLIAAVQAKVPSFRFALAPGTDSVGDHLRLWRGLGPKGSDAVIKGTDFILRDGDRVKSVTGFLDQVPAGV